MAHLETLIFALVLNQTWTGEAKELPFVLGTSNGVYDGVEESDCVQGGLQHLPDHHVFADESAQTNRQAAAKQAEVVLRSLAEDEEAWYEHRHTDKSGTRKP